MNLKPLADRIVVQPIEQEEKTDSGIFLPDTAKEKPQLGEVKAIGTGKVANDGTRLDMTVKVGDKVLFATYAGTEIKLEGEKYLIMNESEVLGIVED